jgi:hypothetical protein
MAPTKRGSFEKAISATMSIADKSTALAALERDYYSASSEKPRASYVRSWERMHRQWFGELLPVLPLTPEKLRGVGAMYKAGRYRNFGNPLSAMKGLHLELGHDWSDLLALTAKRVDRSITRGIGPAAQCKSLNLHDVAALGLGAEALAPGGPIGPSNLMIAGSFFMTREIEASLALWGSISFDYPRKLVCWNLPVSKADPQALGKTRTWGCTCCADLDTTRAPIVCPFHALISQRDLVAKALELDLNDLEGFPVFPDSNGQVCDKAAVVATFKAIAELLGFSVEEILDVKGHVCRVSGAQHLAMLGFDIVLIQLMARWASEIALRYIAEAPLGAITDTYRNLAAGRSLASQLDAIVTDVSELRTQLAAMTTSTTTELASERAVASSIALYSDETSVSSVLVNKASGKVHIPYRDCGIEVPGKAKCGWKYTDAERDILPHLPRDNAPLICGVCLPKHKRACRLADSSLAPVSSLVASSSSSS